MSRTMQQPKPTDHQTRPTSPWRWVGFATAPLAVVVLVVISAFTETKETSPQAAVPFKLTTTTGETVSLEETLTRGDALLYFSMGVGCDGCFAQIPEVETALAQRNISLIPIMVDPAPLVAAEAARFGIDLPILIDPDARVSTAYGMIGVYGHGDRPSHSFALVRQNGEVAWVRHYAEMFVPSQALLEELDPILTS